MAKLRWFLVGSLFCSVAIFAAKPIIIPQSSNGPSNTTGRTLKPGSPNGNGCSCHGSAVAAIEGTFLGPTQLYPGDYGIFAITGTKSGYSGTYGINVAASDTTTVLSTQSGGQTQTFDVGGNANNREITHIPTLRNAGAAYNFRYTMPAAAGAGTTHTLYGVIGGAAIGGWDNATNFTITTKALPTAPSTLTPGSPTASSVPLSWSAAGPAYRVLYKTGSYPTSPTDGTATVAYDGTSTSTTVTGLAASTMYFFKVFSKDTGVDSGATFFSTSAAQNTATTTSSASAATWWVNANGGSDTNGGMTYPTSFKTITKAMTMALSGDTINVMPGTYNTALGETFPITLKSGVRLMSYLGANITIVDATGANKRVFNMAANSSTTLLQGFTITGGLHTGTTDGSNTYGGGIYASGGDQTVITRNIIKNNEARGYPGVCGGSYPSGGQVYGGGISAVNTANTITNNVIMGNIARGGAGCNAFGSGTGSSGGGAHGGGLELSGTTVLANNTVHANMAIGGAGGFSFSGTGASGGVGEYGGISGAGAVVAFNNIIANNVATGGTGGGGSPNGSPGPGVNGGMTSLITQHHNLFFNNTGGHGVSGGEGSIYDQNPKFISATDVHISPTSPAAGTGTASGAPTVDLDGVMRPNPPSMGAYEAPRKFRKSFNSDNYADLVWRNSSTGQSAIWFMNGAVPTEGSGLTSLQFSNNAFVVGGVGDFNGDGKADLVWRNNTSGETFIWFMNGNTVLPASGALPAVPAGWIIASVGDFNGDGKSDLIWRNTSTGQNSIWLLNGLAIQQGSGTLNAVGDVNWYIAGTGDFNGDGRSDLLWRNDTTGTSSMWMMNGAALGGDSGPTQLQIPTAWRAQAVGDFNGDGRSDLLWRNINTGENIMWLLNGSVVIEGSGQVNSINDTAWNAVASGDYNNDGYDDIVWRNEATGGTSIWMMIGTAVGPGSGTLGQIPPPWQLAGPR